MLLTLVALLLLLNISIRIIIVGVDLAFIVGGRVDALRRSGEWVLLKKAAKGSGTSAKTAIKAIDTSRKVVEASVGAVAAVSKLAAKSTLKIVLKVLKWCTQILINLLISAGIVVMVIEFLVFMILVAICGYWMNYMM